MNRTTYSEKQELLVQCINHRKQTFVVLFDERKEQAGGTTDETGEDSGREQYSYQQAIFPFPPPMTLIKKTVKEGINERIRDTIESGFEWQGHKVWLSEDNQRNYEADHNIAILTAGKNLPVTFKFGTDEEPDPYTFEDTATLMDFWTKARKFINDTLEAGRREKEDIDWSKYMYYT